MSLPNTTEEHRPEPDPGSGPHKLPIALATVGALVLDTALGWGVRAPESTEAYRELSEEHTVTGTELAETREAEAAQQETIDDLRDELTALAEPLEELDEREADRWSRSTVPTSPSRRTAVATGPRSEHTGRPRETGDGVVARAFGDQSSSTRTPSA